ncbi:SMC family ATPase [Limosilactobacillus sp. WILCCON 0053]|uniref:SMC family ATPase n=1 Tax=Limosilactobacillus allomucosae TaxID=3142938 RepID=UPI0032668924
MKPLKLKMEYFGSYVNETVDFAQFDEVPLFLISGKTGSGKTTIFDAMCFSLFGSTTDNNRNGRTAEKLRSDFAKEKDLTRVSFWFEHQGKTYQIIREPKQDRHKSQKVELFYEKNGQKEEITKVTDANQFIEDLIGINADQFRQIVLLPQGKFREFLESDSNNKNQLLAELFGTQLYADWTQQLKDQLTAAQDASHDSQKQMEHLMTSIEELADQTDPVQWLQAAATLLEQHEQQLAQQTEAAVAAQAKAKKLDEQFHVEQNLQDAYDELVQNQAAQKQLNQQQSAIQAKQQLIDELQWVGHQQADYVAWQHTQTAIQDLQNDLQQRQTEAEKLDQKLQQLQNRAQELKQQQPAIDSINQQKIALESLLPRYQETAELKERIQTEQQKLAKLQKSQQQVQAVSQQQTTLLEKTAQQIQSLQLQTDRQLIEKMLEERSTGQALLKRLQDLQSKHQTITGQQASLQQAQHEEELAGQHYQTAQTAFQEADQKHAALQIAELATHLAPGQPCPVCGSIDHPHPGNLAAKISLDEIQAAGVALKQARQVLDDAQVQKVKAQEKAANLTQQLTLLKAEYTTELTKLRHDSQLPATDLAQLAAKLQERINEVAQRLKKTQAAIEELKQAQQEQQKQQQTLDELTAQQQKLDHDQQLLTAQLAGLNGELTAKVKQLPPAYADLMTAKKQLHAWQIQLQDYQQKKDQNQTELQHQQQRAAAVAATISHDQENLTQQQNRSQQLTTTLQQALKDHDPNAQWSRYAEDFAQLDQLESLQQTVNEYQQAVKINLDRRQHLLAAINERPRPQLAETQKALQAATAIRDEKQRELGRLKEQQKQQQKTVQQVDEIQQEQGKQQAELDRLSDLVNTMNGKNSMRLTLERYVLRHYFKEVLSNANPRLRQLTADRYEFFLEEGTGSNNKWSGLEVGVRDRDAGKDRSVHTLSGGETFAASLALALSLGEIIQQQAGGIQIDALFVDEGFGSLDQAALDNALQALQTLEGNSRMVGIISHVTELEERIPDQLKISSDKGHSHVSYQHDFAIN